MNPGRAGRILAWCSPGEVRVAALDGDALLDAAIWRPGAPDGVGDTCRGRVDAAVPAMAGAFVAIPGAVGFLPDSEGAAGLGAGQAVTVRVVRAAQGGKGPRLSARGVESGGAGPPALLRRGPGAVERLAALHAGASVLVDDLAMVARLRPALGARVFHVARLDDDALAAFEALSDPVATLPGGLRASFHPTPALVAIDLDTGALTAERRAKGAAQWAANLAVLPALARQIRLRNLSGAVVVDLAGLSVRRRAALVPEFARALADDPLAPRFLGFSALGLAEILRPRAHPPLHELLAGPHAAGLRALRRIAAEVAARPAAAFTLRAAPDVVEALRTDADALPDLARRTGRSLMVRSDPALPPGTCAAEEAHRA